jgi:hypothetical protein
VTISISPPCTAADREKSVGAANNELKTNNRAASALSVDGFSVGVSAKKGRAETKEQGGETLPAKARAFHARIAALRKQPGNCGRCGKPNANGLKQCDRCRAYMKAYKEAVAKKPRSIATFDANALMRRVVSLEMRLAKVECELALRRNTYRYVHRRQAVLLKRSRPQWEPPTITKQELSTMNHAYASLDAA